MKIAYEVQGNGYELLKQSNLPWLATDAFGLDLLLGRNPGPQFHAYVRAADMREWQRYLQSSGAHITNNYGDIALSPVKNLDALRNGLQIPVVEFSRLVRDAAFSCPRYIENVHPEIRTKFPEVEKELEKFLEELSAR